MEKHHLQALTNVCKRADYRVPLQCIRIKQTDSDKAELTATEGHIIVKLEAVNDPPNPAPESFLLHHKYAEDICKIQKSKSIDNPIRITADEKVKAQVDLEKTIEFPLIADDKKFPNVDRFMAEDYSEALKIAFTPEILQILLDVCHSLKAEQVILWIKDPLEAIRFKLPME